MSAEESLSYPRFFNATELGCSLKEVAVDNIRTSTNQVVTSRWFHSPHEVDLFIWLDQSGQVIKQQVSFYGQVVEWNVIEGVKTGLIIEEEQKDGRRFKASEMIQFDHEPQLAPIEQAIELCQHITALDESERHLLLGHFRSASGRSTLSNEQFVERFGALLERAPRPTKISALGRFLRYIFRPFK